MAEPLAGSLRDIEEADALREAAEAALDWRPVGHKIGATSRAIQTRLGAAGPFHSALFAERTFASGAQLDLPEGALGIECEIAVKIEETPARPPETLDQAARLVASVHPAIELVGVRMPDGLRPDVRACIADFGLSVTFVFGTDVDPAALPDLAALPVTATVNGQQRASGTGAEVLGHPLNAIIYLSQALAREGRQLQGGSWVTTGTCVGIVPVRPGDLVTGWFGPLGTLEARFR
ncbi:fumarylacetoacetate hydrolase family protein [Rhodovibrio sodomensis]|uniref:fumarylacetoacetate hydrolase family protein n=1 Tax=Rhodovibrio sodomensis TaxID=1088 RepID=UPI001906F218